MSLVINHNSLAINSANDLTSNYKQLSRSTQRLSSGLRVNSAADDAAGLGIRELMRSDITALRQGMRNTNDAISMLQTADGALAIIDEKLIRMKELAEQAATGTYDSVQRAMIDSEFQQMASEIERIAQATDFNGIKILNGDFIPSGASSSDDRYTYEIGGRVNSSPSATLEDIDNTSVRDNMRVGTSTITLTNANVIDLGNGATATLNGDVSILAGKTADFIYAPNAFGQYTWQSTDASLASYLRAGSGSNNSMLFFATATDPNPVLTVSFSTGMNGQFTLSVPNNYPSSNEYRFKYSGDYGSGTIDGTLDPSTNKLTLNIPVNGATFESVIDFSGTPTNSSIKSITYNLTKQDKSAAEIPDDVVKIHFGSGNDSAEDYYYINKSDATLNGLNLSGVSIETQEKAQKALKSVDYAIVKKDEIRAYYGTMQNRLENTMTNLTVQSENLQAAESRISDADVAIEMMNFVRNQILSQSAVAMLTQANSIPQMAMRLIG